MTSQVNFAAAVNTIDSFFNSGDDSFGAGLDMLVVETQVSQYARRGEEVLAMVTAILGNQDREPAARLGNAYRNLSEAKTEVVAAFLKRSGGQTTKEAAEKMFRNLMDFLKVAEIGVPHLVGLATAMNIRPRDPYAVLAALGWDVSRGAFSEFEDGEDRHFKACAAAWAFLKYPEFKLGKTGTAWNWGVSQLEQLALKCIEVIDKINRILPNHFAADVEETSEADEVLQTA